MKRLTKLVTLFWAVMMMCCIETTFAQSGELDEAEADALEFLLLYSETKSEIYLDGSVTFDNQDFAIFSADEQSHAEMLNNTADFYGFQENRSFYGCYLAIAQVDGTSLICDPWQSGFLEDEWDGFLSHAAYLEELSIRELKPALENTDEQPLIDAYAEMLGVAYVHLFRFAAMIHEDPLDYTAQLIDQAEVDLALAEALVLISEGFEINANLNDAWYEPATDGQGFFITVYPEKGTVFVGWFTFDMDFPSQDVIAGLGDACQRWLTAQGSYDGNQANLVVYNSSGGLFDSVLAEPQLEPIGSINLEFENCNSGTVSYDLPSYGLMGEIPIQRVASDNVTACEIESYLSH